MALFGAIGAKSSGDRVEYVDQTLDGSNPTTTNFALKDGERVKAVSVSLNNAAAPGVGTSLLTYFVSGDAVSVFAWKPTSSTNPTLVASTGTDRYSLIAIIGK